MTAQAYHGKEPLPAASKRRDKRGATPFLHVAPQDQKNGRRESRRLTPPKLPSPQGLCRFEFLGVLQFLCHRCSPLGKLPATSSSSGAWSFRVSLPSSGSSPWLLLLFTNSPINN